MPVNTNHYFSKFIVIRNFIFPRQRYHQRCTVTCTLLLLVLVRTHFSNISFY